MDIIWTILTIVFILTAWIYIDYSLGRKNHLVTNVRREYPVRTNRQLDIFAHGPDLFADMFHEINHAKTHIHVLFYISKNDQVSKSFYSLLKTKAREGVEVCLLIDWLGSHKVTQKIRADLEAANVKFAYSNVPKLPFLFYSINVRNHRKITVIDGKIGYVGGFNVGKEYVDLDPKLSPWRDYHLKMIGDSVRDLQTEFLHDWKQATGHDLKGGLAYFPSTKTVGTIPIQVSPTDGVYLEELYTAKIRAAKFSIFIGTPYFIPSKLLLSELLLAIKRGVKITILVPQLSDHILIKEASFSYLRQLLTEGALVYQFLNGFYHAKAFLFDEKICDIGTANFDQRSLFFNHEINNFIDDPTIVKRLKTILYKDLMDSKQLTLTDLNQVSFLTRVKEMIARPIARFL